MAGSGITLPARKRSYRIALTPLADAMFQLLTFFMLTTSLTPYSLITLRTAQDAPTEEDQSPGVGNAEAPAPTSQARGDSRIVIWTLGDGIITTGGQTFESAQIGELAGALASADVAPNVLLIVTNVARIQDVASAMEALRAAEVETVQITNEAR
ncbi:MAG: biopolymer transporter ExbD [Marinovum sp.]|nr:biopolymer transporter ExbD [Marinovum sp.]